MARNDVELDLGLGAEYETSVPGRPLKSGHLDRAFVSLMHDIDMAAIEVHIADGDGSICIFGPPDQLSEQLQKAAKAVATIGGTLRSHGTGPVT